MSEQLQPELGEAIEARLDVLHRIGDVVEPAAPLRQEARDLGVRPGVPSSSMRELPTSNITASMPSEAITWRWTGPTR